MLLLGWTTTGSAASAETLARALVEAGLVACAQVDGPITSVYRWGGEVQTEVEYRLLLKFIPTAQADLEKTLLERHPYDTPEWIVVPANHVTEKYLSWAEANSSSLPL